MTKRTWWLRFITTLLFFGVAACGGDGGGGGGGGGGIPTATNSAIAPPPTTPVAITTAGGAGTSDTNQRIAANAFQASDGPISSANTASVLVGAVAPNGGTQAKRKTLGEIVRRHAEKLKDHQSALTSALQVVTQPCGGGGTITAAFDDANLSATEVFVNCNEGGIVTHGTISSSNVGVSQNLGSTVGSPYTITVTASFTIDLSFTTTATPVSTFVTQSAFSFTTTFSGNMEAAANGGVQPGFPNRVQLSMNGSSLLTQEGTVRELLSNFSIVVDDNDALGRTTVSGSYTAYASTIIGGSVTVNISPALVYQPQGALHPSSGRVTITSPGSPGKIELNVISSTAGVQVDVYANAADASPIDTATLTWGLVDAL